MFFTGTGYKFSQCLSLREKGVLLSDICKQFVLCLILIYSTQAFSKEIIIPHKEIRLNADLALVQGKTLHDGVVLMVHGALAHRDMESQRYIRQLLNDRGYNTLAINLSLGIDNRHGMYDCSVTHRHRNTDAIDEMAVWLKWLQRQGAKQIILMGHSRGGAQTTLFMAEYSSALVTHVVLLAPALKENSSDDTYYKRYALNLSSLLKNARDAIRSGNGNEVFSNIGLMTCADTTATADSLMSYYGQQQQLDTSHLLKKISVSTLVIAAGNDRIVTDLEKKISHKTHAKNIQVVVVEGADHLFRDLNADDAIDYMHEFIQQERHPF